MTDLDFQLDSPLPTPATTTILEASAGTGKTFTLAALVARYILSGVPLDHILAVTFSRRATGELRDGIRVRLERCRQVLAGEWSAELDAVDQLLLAASPDDRLAADRVFAAALSQLDDAPLLTYHAFASRMLDELGLLADHDPGTKMVADLGELMHQVVADSYLAVDSPGAALGWQTAKAIGIEALRKPFEPIYGASSADASRVQFAELVRANFEQRKRARRLLGYDDMIGRLAAALTDPATGAEAALLLSGRFPIVLVDEFQDTDPAQWSFLHAAFAGRSTMILIGDPKQAIYRFRGGDIETYLSARAQADQSWRLAVNHRSDAEVVAGVHSLFRDVSLGVVDAQITAEPVTAAIQQARVRRSSGEPLDAVRIRAMRGEPRQIDGVNQLIRTDLVEQIRELMTGGYKILRAAQDDRQAPQWMDVDARDIAVLVRTNKFGAALHELLVRNGVPAVYTGNTNVYDSVAADDWLALLEALENPRGRDQRRAMLTSLIGWTSADLAGSDTDRLIPMIELLTRCARLLASQGVAAVFETLVSECRIYPRLLAEPAGEALLTDLRHVAELLNEAQRSQQLSPAALIEHLRRSQQRARAESEERTRRLPTDRPAITIMTVHSAKGLQFPIVLLPQASDELPIDIYGDEPMVGHQNGQRVLDVTAPVDRVRPAEGYRDEQLAERLRTFYVGCTRAQSLLICWWANSRSRNKVSVTESSALHRLLHAERDGGVPEGGYKVTNADKLPALPLVSLTAFDPMPVSSLVPLADSGRGGAPKPLMARSFRDHIDRAWVRTSYTGLTAAVHALPPSDAWIESDEVPVTADVEQAEPEDAPIEPLGAASSALADLPGGVLFGSLVHEVLEVVDPAAPDAADQLLAEVSRAAAGSPLADLDTEALAAGLWQTITTPLGELTDGLALRDIGRAAMACELDFELPLGGASSSQRRRVADLARLFDSLDPSDPLQAYGRLLGESAAADQVLAGFLTGSIDVVAQVPGAEPRYLVFDYKTNRVPAAPGQPLTAGHYSPAAMTAAMSEAHYPLQALLYEVALHRYLSWRQPGYRPETHLGGVGYLFVRGMTGPDNPMIGSMPAGVFTWRPPAAMIVAASEVLAGGASDGAAN